MKYNDYIKRVVKAESENAYLVEVIENNRFGSVKKIYKWVSKDCCKKYEKLIIKVSDEYTFEHITVYVSTNVISEGRFEK